MLIIPPPKFRKHRGQIKTKTAPPAPPVPINTITSVVVREDQVTTEIFFSPGTVVTAVNDPDDNFFVNYPGGQTASNTAQIVGPAWVRLVLSDQIDPPSTWEVDSQELFVFASGVFAGPNTGDVIFPV
ncbi:MAG TPA: hypothetical protein VHS31_09035 [Tepidisphaeraceae bacterium]|jgi:hypothetical protein|nr:hypothetical protein [Tepidisphaeraceae bacterium]